LAPRAISRSEGNDIVLLGSVVGVYFGRIRHGVVDEVIGRKPPIAPASVVSDGGWAY